MECKGSKKNGFVTFKSQSQDKKKIRRRGLSDKLDFTREEKDKSSRKQPTHSTAVVPEHLRSSLPDPLQDFSESKHTTSSHVNDSKSNIEISTEIEILKKQLERMQKSKKTPETANALTWNSRNSKQNISIPPAHVKERL